MSDKILSSIFEFLKNYNDPENNNSFDIVYSIDENHWDGRVSLQLKLKDLKN